MLKKSEYLICIVIYFLYICAMDNKDLYDKVNKDNANDKKGIMDFPTHEYNPSSPIGIVQGMIRGDKIIEIVHKPDGIKEEKIRGTAKYIFRDTFPHFTIYDVWLHQEEKLSNSGVRVFRWLCKNLGKDADTILLSPSMIAKDLGYKTAKPIHDGILELLKLGAIYRKLGKEPMYYINVNYVFRGQRWKSDGFEAKPYKTTKPKEGNE